MNDKVNVRMCQGCRQYFPKSKLLRLCAENKEIVLDKSFKGGGRGVYLCSYPCFLKTSKGNRIQSALKCNLNEEVINEIEREFNSV